MRKMNPNRAKNAIDTDTAAALKRGLENMRTSSMGSVRCSSQRTNITTNTTPAASAPSTAGELHPSEGPSMRPHTMAPMPPMDSRTPTGSNRPAARSRLDGSKMAPATRAMTTMGMLTKKIEPQAKRSSRAPPVRGPIATASPDTADHTPMALALSVGWVNTLMRMASVAGNTRAAPTPMAAREAMSWAEVDDKPAITDVAANSTSPIWSMPLRPKRSPRLPPNSSRLANTRA